MLPEEQKSPLEDFLDILAQQSQQGPPEGPPTLPLRGRFLGNNQGRKPIERDWKRITLPRLPRQPHLKKTTLERPALPGLEVDEEETVQIAALPPRTPWWRRRSTIFASISLVIVILLIIVLPGMLFARVLLQFKTVPVTEGNLPRTVAATGPLQGATYDINFTGSGKIAEIDVVVEQHVTQGQLLAKLDLTSLQDAVNQAQAAYQAALTALKGDIAHSRATSGQSGTNIAAAATFLDNAKANLAATELQGQTRVSLAQTTLTNAEASLTTARQQAQASINEAQATETSALAACSTTATTTAAAIPTPTPVPSSVATALQNCQNVATTTFNEAEAAANASVTTAQEAVNAAQSIVTDAEAEANKNNVDAQAVVNAAQKSLNTAIASANLSNTDADVTVRNSASAAQAALTALNTAEHNLQNAVLTAPHAGIVTVINGTVGGTPGVPTSVSTSTTGTSGTFIQIVDPSSTPPQIIANVSEANITHLKVGDTVQFTIIAYGKREFTGVVSAISPNGITVSNVVSFPVTVNIDTNDLQGATLLPGMSATLKLKELEPVLLIPATAVSFAHTATTPIPANGGKPLITAAQALMANAQAQMLLQQLMTQNPAIAAEMPMATFVLVPSSTPGQAVAKPIVLGMIDGNNNYKVLAGLTNGELVIVGVS